MTEQESIQLEQLIDREGLHHVLEHIASICDDKADHIRTSYNDHITARDWSNAAAALCLVQCPYTK